MSQGRRANKNGRIAEDMIEAMLHARGHIPQRQAILGHTIFGGDLRVDLYLPILPGFPDGLVIESKWQEQAGSADEKLVFLVENVRERCYPCPVFIIYGGQGARPGAIGWLLRQVNNQFLYALNYEEFVSWCMKSL